MMPRERLGDLIDNAARYTPASGRVIVRAPVEPGVASDDTDENRRIRLEAEDTGPGIPAHERGHVLEHIYRILGRDGESSGLGARDRGPARQHTDHRKPCPSSAPHLAGTLVRVGFVPRRTARE